MAEPLRRRMRVRALRGLSRATGTPADPLVRAALAGAAGIARFTRAEDVTRRNLLRVGAWSGERRAQIARGVRRHAARQLHEWLVLADAQRGGEARARVETWLERTVALAPSARRLLEPTGRGLLIATAHIGNWELLAARLRLEGLRGAVVGFRKARDPAADWLVSMRRGLGVETLPQDAPPRQVLAVPRRGEALGILCDLDGRRVDHVVIPFLGVPARTMTAPAALARAAGLPLWPVRCVARGPGYVVEAGEPLEVDRGPGRREGTLELLRRLNGIFGQWILEDPEQWAWHQRRFVEEG